MYERVYAVELHSAPVIVTTKEGCGLECIGEDGFHPNELGYELIAQEMEGCK